MRNDEKRLQDILQAIDDIRDFVGDMTRDQFLKVNAEDRLTFRAVCDCISSLGEAVKNLSDETRSKSDDIDWRGLAGMKDIVVHQYFRVQLDLVWNTITDELPALRAFVESELE